MSFAQTLRRYKASVVAFDWSPTLVDELQDMPADVQFLLLRSTKIVLDRNRVDPAEFGALAVIGVVEPKVARDFEELPLIINKL